MSEPAAPERRANANKVGQKRGPAVVLAAITFVVALVLTATLSVSVRRTARDDAEAQFRQTAAQTAAGVRGEISKYFTSLDDLGALVGSVPAVTPRQFEDYVRSAKVFDRVPSIVGVLYLQRADEASSDQFIAQARAANPNWQPLFLTADQPSWPRYFLMQYVPGQTNLRLPVGAEISSIKAITDVLAVSAQTGKGVVGSFQHDPFVQKLAEDMKQVPVQDLLDVDFFIGVPVYAPPAAGTPTGEPLGWTAAPIARFQDVVTQAARGTPQGIGMSMTVNLTESLATRDDLSRVAQLEGTAGPRDRAAFRQDETFETDGVTFNLSVWSTADAADPPNTVAIVLLAGLLGSVLAAFVMYLRIRSHDRERAFAAEVADRSLFQREIVDSVTSAMVVLDANGAIVEANPAWSELLGFRAAGTSPELATDRGLDYVGVMRGHVPGGADALAAGVRRVLADEEGAVELDLPLEHGRVRRWYTVRATPLRGVHGGAVVVHTDITERKRSHDELEFKASRDNLTGLLNRAALETEVDEALRRARADGTSAGVLFIDLDGFKQINDAYGHAVGDEVLRTVSTRISSAVRTTDRVGRLGGDEFVVLIAPLVSDGAAHTTAERILRAFEEPLMVDEHLLSIAASVGVAVVDSPLDVSSADVIERADEAMYRAKEEGGSRFEISP
ncbi:MAG: diguanylate cyclase [Actinobacteria bacterium]|nr:diguanylate cyclase [Actinomycetota bacterium]